MLEQPHSPSFHHFFFFSIERKETIEMMLKLRHLVLYRTQSYGKAICPLFIFPDKHLH